MKDRADYYRLQLMLDAAAERLSDLFDSPPHFTDECQDRENVLDATDIKEGTEEFWDRMCASAVSYASQVADERGLSLTRLLAKWEVVDVGQPGHIPLPNIPGETIRSYRSRLARAR